MGKDKRKHEIKTQVPWNEAIYMTFVKLAMLSSREREVMRMRIMNYSVSEMAETLGVCERTINRTVERLKVKYDNVQPLSDGVLPVRRRSAEEDWMDNN